MSATQQAIASYGASVAAGGITFISVGTAAINANPTVTLPPIYQSGDLLVIAAVSGTAGGTGQFTTPAGWSLGVSSSAAPKIALFYKVATGSESSVELSGGTNGRSQAVMLSYRNVNATPLDVAGTVANGTSASATTNTLTTVTNLSMVVSLFTITATNASFTGYPSVATVRFDGSSNANAYPILVADEIKTPAGLTTARVATLVSDGWQTYATSFKP